MQRKDFDIAKKYKKSLLDLGIPIDEVIVFGSRAMGTAHTWSDLDICVLSPLFDVDRFSERSLLTNIGKRISVDIEPHPMTKEELNNKFNPLANEIRKHGVVV